MSPRKLLDRDDEDDLKQQQSRTGVVINGPRPMPLKIKQESHTINKQQHQQKMIKRPIIIYTYSPQVIHTKPDDFMALVQKLTGSSRTKEQEQEQQQETLRQDHLDQKGDDSSNYANSSMFNVNSNNCMGDIPLFTPNSSDYFCSTRPLFRFSDMVSSSPNMGASLSPGSLVELLKGLPEY